MNEKKLPPFENGKILPMSSSNSTHQSDRKKETGEKGQKKDSTLSQTDVLLKLAKGINLFHDEGQTPYGCIKIDDHYEVWPIESKYFESFLISKFLKIRKRAPGKYALEEAIRTISAHAIHVGPTRDVFRRVASHEGRILVDLCDEKWRVISIGPNGWKVLNRSPVHFIRTPGMRELPTAVKGGSIDELRPFLNVSSERDFRLIIGWLIAAFRPGYPFPILILQGEQGSSKSTTAKVLREFIDPSTVPLTSIPRNERDLMIQASNSWVNAYDNLSGLSVWLSDCLCRIASGGGYQTRKLYTDRDQTSIKVQRPIILNGIDEIATRGDLLDRSIVLELPGITDRKSEQEFWEEFEKVKPYVFGALLEIVSSALSKINETKLESDIRMMDLAHWITAAEEALGWPEGQFINDYQANKEEAMTVILNDNPLAQAVFQIANREGFWRGSAAEFREAVRSPDIFKPLDIPRSPSHIGRGLNRLKPSMRKYGILLERKRESTNNYWVIQKLDSTEPSTPSRDGSNGK